MMNSDNINRKIFHIIKKQFSRMPAASVLRIVVSVCIIFSAIFSSIVTSIKGSAEIRDTMVSNGIYMTDRLSHESRLSLIMTMGENVVGAANSVIDHPDVARIEILEINGKPLLTRGKPIEELREFQNLAINPTTSMIEAESDEYWQFIAPVVKIVKVDELDSRANSELLGYVRVIQEKKRLKEARNRIFSLNLIISTTFALFLLIVMRLLTGRMSHLFQNLYTGMGNAERGKFQYLDVPDWPRDIRVMSKSFNSMIRSIQESQSFLEYKIDERTSEYKLAIDQLTAAKKELEAFNHSVSHDLRTPLKTIKGFAALLTKKHLETTDPQAASYIEYIIISTQRMEQMITALLKLSRLDQTALQVKEIDITEIATSITNELQLNSPERSVNIVIDPEMRANADYQLVRILMQNLIDNAWKFTSKKESAEIKIGKLIQFEKDVFFVKDNGAGFKKEYVGNLFGPFRRLHSETEFPGIGIGLANALRIINRHGGKIWAEGEEGQGATFYFTF